MSAGRTIGLALLGLVVGGGGGSGIGMLSGLVYAELAAASSFEGKPGFIVAG
jgi:hypothetical protein